MLDFMHKVFDSLFSQCGMSVGLLVLIVIAEGLALRFLFNKFLEILDNNNNLINKLTRRVEEHDANTE